MQLVMMYAVDSVKPRSSTRTTLSIVGKKLRTKLPLPYLVKAK
ncbi:6028_t:CDS:2 [Entrophospora sp. SA101]|nr:6028_t:CDS:2 [Entrophospora sp. SA101]